jgi:hypothetical protein
VTLESLSAYAAVASAVFAAIAAFFSAVSVRRNSNIADRQHALAYTHDVKTWATEVLGIHEQAEKLFSVGQSDQKRYERAINVANSMNRLLDYASLILPDPNSQLMEAAYTLKVLLLEDIENARRGLLMSNRPDRYLHNRTAFVNYVRTETRVTKRYQDAQKYLGP